MRYVILFDADIKKYDENNQETCKDSIITGIKYGILKNCLKMIKNVELLVYSPSIENGYSLLLHKDEEFAPIAIWTESNEQPFANDEQIDYSNLNNYMS